MKNTASIEHHNCVDILIFNDRNELALQMRSINDKSYPGHWDFSAGGHVKLKEQNRKAAEREVLEELGVTGQLIFISEEHLQYPSWNNNIIRNVDVSIYKMHNNGPFKIEPNEIEKIVFFDLGSIQKMVDKGTKFHPEFLLIWNILNFKLDQKGVAF